MGESIKEKIDKIKTSTRSFLSFDDLLLGLLIPCIAIAGFGLGRLSVAESGESIPRVQITAPAPVISDAERPSQEREAAHQETEGAYVGSVNSDKYHLPWCSGAERIRPENEIWFDSKAEAEDAGYVPAGNCAGI